MLISFSKYTGCGNDFICIDHRTPFPNLPIRSLCDRRFGIGADGLILLESSTQADSKIRYFNANGKEADLCGNGLRCFHRFYQEVAQEKKTLSIETPRGILTSKGIGDEVAVQLPNPILIDPSFEIEIENQILSASLIDTGVPHVVLFEPTEKLRDIRFHPRFAPEGANVNIVTKKPDGSITLRTYERGVEAETLACGTGAAAAAIALSLKKQQPSPIAIETASGQTLTISFCEGESGFNNLWLQGPAFRIFTGTVEDNALLR